MTTNRFRCSAEAARTWGRLIAIYEFVRAGVVEDRSPDRKTPCAWGKGDAQPSGRKWDASLSPSKGRHSDLGTDARLLYVMAGRAMELLAVMGPDQMVAATLAQRRLSGHGTNQEERRFGLDKETRDELLDGAREFLHWSVDPDALELPDLPF